MTVVDRIVKETLGDLYFLPSIQNGLVGAFQPRRSETEAIVNRAPGATSNAMMVGKPTFTAHGAVLGPEAYLETTLPETPQYTLCVIARKNPAGGVSLVSSLAGSRTSTSHAYLGFRLTTPVRPIHSVKTTPATSEQNIAYNLPANDNGYVFLSSSCNGATLAMLLPGNEITGSGNVNPRTDALSGTRDAPVNNWRIGAARIVTANFPNSTEIVLVLIYDRALSELEKRGIHAEVMLHFRPRGVLI